VTCILGLHLTSDLPVGTDSSRAGPIMAAVDRFHITVNGKGGHGGRPDTAVDALVTGAQLVCALQTMVSRPPSRWGSFSQGLPST